MTFDLFQVPLNDDWKLLIKLIDCLSLRKGASQGIKAYLLSSVLVSQEVNG